MNSRHGARLSLGIVLVCCSCSGRQEISYQGYVEGEFVYLASSLGGRLEHLTVTRGEQVAAGAPLFALDAVDERAADNAARQQLATANAQLADLQSGKRAPEVGVVRAQLEQSRAAAQKSTLQRERDAAQLRAGGVSQQQFEATVAQADSDAARVLELEAQLSVAQLPGRVEQLRAQAGVVEAARATLAQADWRLDQKSVAAPKAGLIYDTLYREGEWIQPGSPVVRMLPPENTKVRFFVPETVLGSLTLGQRVSLHCDGCIADVPATIVFLSPEAEFTPPVIFSNETRGKLVYLIEARPTREDAPRLHPGQPLSVRVP